MTYIMITVVPISTYSLVPTMWSGTRKTCPVWSELSTVLQVASFGIKL